MYCLANVLAWSHSDLFWESCTGNWDSNCFYEIIKNANQQFCSKVLKLKFWFSALRYNSGAVERCLEILFISLWLWFKLVFNDWIKVKATSLMPSWGLLSQFWIQQQILSGSENMLWIKENTFCLCHPVTPELAPAKIFFNPAALWGGFLLSCCFWPVLTQCHIWLFSAWMLVLLPPP